MQNSTIFFRGNRVLPQDRCPSSSFYSNWFRISDLFPWIENPKNSQYVSVEAYGRKIGITTADTGQRLFLIVNLAYDTGIEINVNAVLLKVKEVIPNQQLEEREVFANHLLHEGRAPPQPPLLA